MDILLNVNIVSNDQLRRPAFILNQRFNSRARTDYRMFADLNEARIAKKKRLVDEASVPYFSKNSAVIDRCLESHEESMQGVYLIRPRAPQKFNKAIADKLHLHESLPLARPKCLSRYPNVREEKPVVQQFNSCAKLTLHWRKTLGRPIADRSRHLREWAKVLGLVRERLSFLPSCRSVLNWSVFSLLSAVLPARNGLRRYGNCPRLRGCCSGIPALIHRTTPVHHDRQPVAA